MSGWMWLLVALVVLFLAAETEQAWRDSKLPPWQKLIWAAVIYAFLTAAFLGARSCVA